jgi:hypothetical protein
MAQELASQAQSAMLPGARPQRWCGLFAKGCAHDNPLASATRPNVHAALRCSKAGRSRSRGCQTRKPACPPAISRPRADRWKRTRGRACRSRIRRHRRPARGAGRRNDAAAPVAEPIAIRRDRHGRIHGQAVGDNDVRRAREMCAQYHDHWRQPRELVVHFESDAKLHSKYVAVWASKMTRKPSNPSSRLL